VSSGGFFEAFSGKTHNCLFINLGCSMELSMKKLLSVGSIAITLAILGHAQSARPQQSPTAPAPAAAPAVPQQAANAGAASAATQRALLDQYCVTCHNDKLKTASLSLEGLDLATVGDHGDLWEKVVRKLRAGVMPPPGVRRPDLAAYNRLTEWLETEIDRKAKTNPGSVVLHRLNRSEYANAVRDLLGLEIDPTTLLPPDDASRGFDNVAGSLTISSTLLESYANAAAKVARMAVGYWKTPTERTYITPTDTSQEYQIEGLPFGTRGGVVVTHVFPSDGEYKFSIKDYVIGPYIGDEQLELSIDGARVAVVRMERTQVRRSGRRRYRRSFRRRESGTHTVGATLWPQTAAQSLISPNTLREARWKIAGLPGFTNYPEVGFLRISGPFGAIRPYRLAQHQESFYMQAGEPPLKRKPASSKSFRPLARRAYRRPVLTGGS
jgi:cytochrome c5